MATIQKTLTMKTTVQRVFELLIAPTGRRRNEENTGSHLRHPRLLVTCTLLALLLSTLALMPGGLPRAWAASAGSEGGHVYVLNNDLSGSNSITVFNRQENGSLKLVGSTSIGGLGSLTAFADGIQGSLILTPDRTRLFAADAGSDQISVVNVHNGHLSLAGVFASSGAGPVSLTYQNHLLYVLNAANGRTQAANVAGFRVDDRGNLHPIPGATQLLTTAHPNPAQVQIDPSGRFLLVTEKLTNLIDVYAIHSDGSLSSATSFSSVGVYPFGMAFNPASPQEVIVDDGFGLGGKNPTGAVTAYKLAEGNVHLINGPVPDYQVAPCWMVITHDGHFAYTTDADSHTVSGYRIHDNGAISLLSANGLTASTPSDTFPLEEGISHDNNFLYTLDSRLLLKTPGPVTLSGFLIHNDGSLTSVVNSAQIVLPFTAIGMAAE